MTNRPWGPHGEDTEPNTVKPGPTGRDPVLEPKQSEEAPLPAGGGDPFSGIVINIVIGFFMLIMFWMPMVCLYPLTSAAGAAAGFLSRPIFVAILPEDAGDVPLALALALGAGVIALMIRIEGRLAKSAQYRAARHVVRMVLLGLLAVPVIYTRIDASAPYVWAVVTSPSAIVEFFSTPSNAAIWLAAMVGVHVLLVKGEPVRRFWHQRLKWIGLGQATGGQ